MNKKKKTTWKADFSALLGDERNRKFKRIAESQGRTKAGQLRYWIDHSPFGRVELTPEEAFVRQREDGAVCAGLAAETEGR